MYYYIINALKNQQIKRINRTEYDLPQKDSKKLLTNRANKCIIHMWFYTNFFKEVSGMYMRVKASIVDLSKAMVRNRKVAMMSVANLWADDASSCY